MKNNKNNNKELLRRYSSQARRNTIREINTFFLIVCEGEKTEPLYFNSFPRKNTKKEIIEIECKDSGGKTSAMQVVNKAIELKNKSNNKYDSIWAVFDKDQNAPETFHKAIEKAENENIKIAWSNEAFEIWYILHFQYLESSISRSQYKNIIEKVITEKSNTKFRYTKSTKNMYELITSLGDQSKAILYAKKMEKKHENTPYALCNPRTTVYKLVEELCGLSKDFLDSL